MCKDGIYYVNIRIHHGGVFTYKNRIRLYEEGKVELVYCQSIDTICLDSCKDLVEKRLGYKNYKIYWHKEGESLDNCQLLWSEDIVNDMCTYATKTGTCVIYVDHACENVNECDEDEKYVSEDSGSSDYYDYNDEEGSDFSNRHYSENESDKDEELNEIIRNSLLAAVGNENRKEQMTYVVAKEYLEAFGSNATINAYTQWRNRGDVVQWLISLVRNDDSPPALSDSYLVPRHKRHGSSIDEEEKPAQGNPIKSFPKKLRSSLVQQKQDTGRSNAINIVPPKEAAASEPTDSYLVPRHKRHGSSIDEEEKPAQGNPIKSFRKKLRSSLVHQKQDTGRSNAINLVPPKDAAASEPTDSSLVPNHNGHGSSIDEEEKPSQGNLIKSFPKKLRSSLVHQKQDTGRSNAINLVPPKQAAASESTGQFTPGEYSNRVEKFFGMSIRTFRGLCTLVKEPLCNSPKYKFNDNRELTLDAKVAIAMRRLKLGKSLNSIGNEIGMHSFTVDKVTRSFVEAVNGLSHLHGPGAATKEGMSAETLDSAVEEGMSVEKLDRLKEEWKVLTTGMKPEKLRSMIKACCILHNIVTDMND
ncbi:hypothetical protein ACET3Z_001951 [Daucus carota]